MVLALVVMVLYPEHAEAHLVTTGLGPVFDGIGHLFLTLEDVLPVVAVTLYAGLRGRVAARRVLFVLPAAWLGGGILGLQLAAAPPLSLTIASFVLFGGLLAAEAPLPPGIVTALAVAFGVLHGMINGAAMAEARLGVQGLVGVVVSLFVVAALLSALAVSLTRPWTRIALRVAGSWVVATGLLLLGWAVRGAR